MNATRCCHIPVTEFFWFVAPCTPQRHATGRGPPTDVPIQAALNKIAAQRRSDFDQMFRRATDVPHPSAGLPNDHGAKTLTEEIEKEFLQFMYGKPKATPPLFEPPNGWRVDAKITEPGTVSLSFDPRFAACKDVVEAIFDGNTDKAARALSALFIPLEDLEDEVGDIQQGLAEAGHSLLFAAGEKFHA